MAQKPLESKNNTSDTALAAPRFDTTAAERARPVVPLAAVAPKRRFRLFAFFFIPAFMGGILGAFGLRLYQGHRAPAPPPAMVKSPAPAASKPVIVAATPTPPAGTTNASPNMERVVSAKPAPPSVPSVAIPAPAGTPAASTEQPPKPDNGPDSLPSATPAPKPEETGNPDNSAAQNKDEEPDGSGRIRLRRTGGSSATRRADTAEAKNEETEPRARAEDISKNKPSPRSEQPAGGNQPQPRNIDRIRDIFEGHPPR